MSQQHPYSFRGAPTTLYQLDSQGRPVPAQLVPAVQGYQAAGYQQTPQIQPPAQPSSPSKQAAELDAALKNVTATLDTTADMIEKMTASGEFQTATKSVLALIVSQLKEIKVGQFQLSHSVQQQHSSQQRQFRDVYRDLDDIGRSAVKAEQYQRRNTVTLVGVPYTPQETPVQLAEAVAKTLSLSGEQVTVQDLEITHRNGKQQMYKGKPSTPTVTARLKSTVKKDSVLKQYRNYDAAANKPRPIAVYQSLSKHYSDLRKSIVKFFDPSEDNMKHFGLPNHNKFVKWVRFVSCSAGLAVKLRSDEYMRNIHSFNDFTQAFEAIQK